MTLPYAYLDLYETTKYFETCVEPIVPAVRDAGRPHLADRLAHASAELYVAVVDAACAGDKDKKRRAEVGAIAAATHCLAILEVVSLLGFAAIDDLRTAAQTAREIADTMARFAMVGP